MCDPVRLELLAGARSARELDQRSGLLGRLPRITTTPFHHDRAAALSRDCRRAGETPRKLIDCLIAAHAVVAEVALLEADADFAVRARHTSLTLATPRA